MMTNESIPKLQKRRKSKEKWFGHARVLSNERNGPSDRTELLSPKQQKVSKKKAIKALKNNLESLYKDISKGK